MTHQQLKWPQIMFNDKTWVCIHDRKISLSLIDCVKSHLTEISKFALVINGMRAVILLTVHSYVVIGLAVQTL